MHLAFFSFKIKNWKIEKFKSYQQILPYLIM